MGPGDAAYPRDLSAAPDHGSPTAPAARSTAGAGTRRWARPFPVARRPVRRRAGCSSRPRPAASGCTGNRAGHGDGRRVAGGPHRRQRRGGRPDRPRLRQGAAFDRAGVRRTYGENALRAGGFPSSFSVRARSDLQAPRLTSETACPPPLTCTTVTCRCRCACTCGDVASARRHRARRTPPPGEAASAAARRPAPGLVSGDVARRLVGGLRRSHPLPGLQRRLGCSGPARPTSAAVSGSRSSPTR